MTRASDQGLTANLLNALALQVAGAAHARLAAATGRTGSDTEALVALAVVAPGASQDTLAGMLQLSQSAVTRLVDRLAAAHLVVRAAGTDHRTVALRLTPDGARLAEHALEAREAATRGLLGALDPAEAETLTALLRKLLAAGVHERADALRTCRICDARVCHDLGRCPVTEAAAAAAR